MSSCADFLPLLLFSFVFLLWPELGYPLMPSHKVYLVDKSRKTLCTFLSCSLCRVCTYFLLRASSGMSRSISTRSHSIISMTLSSSLTSAFPEFGGYQKVSSVVVSFGCRLYLLLVPSTPVVLWGFSTSYACGSFVRSSKELVLGCFLLFFTVGFLCILFLRFCTWVKPFFVFSSLDRFGGALRGHYLKRCPCSWHFLHLNGTCL